MKNNTQTYQKNNIKSRLLGNLLRSRTIINIALVLTGVIASISMANTAYADSISLPRFENSESDFLYIGDDLGKFIAKDGTKQSLGDVVKRFDARTGAYVDQALFIKSPLECQVTRDIHAAPECLFGPRGVIFDDDELLVVNQNANRDDNGSVLAFSQKNGTFLNALVSSGNDDNSPLAPHGMVRVDNMLLVADQGNFIPAFASGSGLDEDIPGHIYAFDRKTGSVLFRIDGGDVPGVGSFHPNAIVIGPDGIAYVSQWPLQVHALNNDPSTGVFTQPSGGQVLRFNPHTGAFLDIFIDNSTGDGKNCGGCELNRPEGIVFDPNKKLYITSSSSAGTKPTLGADDTTDKILIFRGKKQIDKIDLDTKGELGGPEKPRALAVTLLFGPKGKLFVPIHCDQASIGPRPTCGNVSGEVRRYDVSTKKFEVFIPSSLAKGPLVEPWYLTFGKTNPSTLGYDND
jgi:outer membrane protein assembly factor BamB